MALKGNQAYKIIFWTGYAAMLIMSVMPVGGNLSQKHVGSVIRMDYFLHFLVYLAICLYFFMGRRFHLQLFHKKPVLKFILVILFLACITEVVQLAVPSRTFNPWDMMSNVCGVILGLLVFWSPGLLVVRKGQGTRKK